MTCSRLLMYLLGVFSAIILTTEGYVRYENCTEYVYNFRSRITLHGTTSIQLKGKVGFEFLSSKTTEAILHVYDARMAQNEEEVDLLTTYNVGRWFSFSMSNEGEILEVFYPKNEDLEVLSLKKTLAGYMSGKLAPLHKPQNYETLEAGPDGHHKARYQRRVDSFDTVFTKRKDFSSHVAAAQADLEGSKVTYVSHELRVPHKIEMEERMRSFHRPKPGYRMPRPPVGPNANFSIDRGARGQERNIPGIKVESFGRMELIDRRQTPCAAEKPTGLVSGGLPVVITDADNDWLWKTDYEKEIVKTHASLEGNLTCVRHNLQKVVHENSNCFQNILKILRAIPEPYYPDIAYAFMEFRKRPSPRQKQDRLTMIDAFLSLRSQKAQEVVLQNILSPNSSASDSDRLADFQRALLQFGGFEAPPIPAAVDFIESIAFGEATTEEEKDIQRMGVLGVGIMVSLLHHHGNAEEKLRAVRMIHRLEKRVGIHDPFHWRRKRSAENGRYESEMEAAAGVEALGNAGLPRSYHHVLSHVNCSGTPFSLKRAGLHALRNFHTEEAAGVLLDAALFDEEEHIRNAAISTYVRHPLARDFYKIHRNLLEGYSNGTFPRCPKKLSDEDLEALPHHHRVMRRSVWKGFQFHLKLPYVEWARQFGNKYLGASMGLKLQNELDIDIKLTSGKVRVTVDDHAFAIGHIGYIGKNLELLDGKLCLIGHADYELNLLQEFGFDDVTEFVKFWDRFQNGVVKNIKQAVEKFRQFMTGFKDFSRVIRRLDNIIDDFPRKVKNLRNVAINAARKIGAIDPKAIPPFVQPLLRVYRRIIKLENDVKSDVMDFYNTLADVVKIEIPTSWRQIREGVYTVGKSIKSLFKSPKEAMSGMFKAVTKVKIGIEGLKDSKARIEESCFFLQDEKPYWWDLSGQLTEIFDELRAAMKTFDRGVGPWIEGRVDSFEREMRREMKRLLLEVKEELTLPLNDLRNLAKPFVSGIFSFQQALEGVREAWEQLKIAYREGRSIIDRLFGPKAQIAFPKKLRSAGAGCDDGSYPTTTGGRYTLQGVDLEAEAGKKVRSPFGGFASVDRIQRLVIYPDGDTFEDIVVYIDNLDPVDIPREPGRKRVYSGDVIGVSRSTACVNHLHLAMTEGGQVIDPTRYMGRRQMKNPTWVQVCDEYKLVYLGRTQAEGYILKTKEEVDTSPKRSTSEPSNVDLPSPKSEKRRRKRDVSSVVKSVTANFNKFKTTMMKFFDIPGDLGFTKFFRDFSIRKIKMGTMVGLLKQLGMKDSKEELIKVINSFIDLTKATRCVRPEQMTEEELRIALVQRGVQTNDSRSAMIDAYYDSTGRCPLWGLSLPPKSACSFDKDCLAVDCCFDYRVGIFYKAVRAFANLDPCTQILRFGVTFWPRKWTHSIQIRPIPFGEESAKMTGLKVDIFGTVLELKIIYLFSNDKETALLNVQAALCQSESDCLPDINVIKDMLLPVPSCAADGDTIIWPQINLKDFFSRENIINELKKVKTNVVESAKDRTLAYIEEELGLPSGFLRKDSSVYCSRPSRMTRPQLLNRLGLSSSSAATSALREDLRAADRKCRYFELPPPPRALHCALAEDCFRFDCCLDVQLPLLNRSVALSAFVHFEPCQFRLTFGFAHRKKSLLLLDYPWGTERRWALGKMSIKYVIDKTPDSKFFVLKFGIDVCPRDGKCLLDYWILDNHRVPVPICNENFTNCLSNDISWKALMEKGVVAVSKDAVSMVMRCLDVEKYLLVNHSCPIAKTCTSNPTPLLDRTCYPGRPCWRFQCNFPLNLFVMTKKICAWFAFNPCSYDLELGLAGWKFRANLMKVKLGVMHEIFVGKTLRVHYRFREGPKSFIIKFGVELCVKKECTKMKYIMNDMEIGKPFCDLNFTQTLPGGSIPKFLWWLGVNSTTTVAKLAVDRALTFLGIRPCLRDATCVIPSGVSLDGWTRTCPDVSNLPALTDNLRCSMADNCRSFKCCLDADIKIWEGALDIRADFDPCSLRVRVGFENCTKELQMLTVGEEKEFSFHSKVKYKVLAEHEPSGKGVWLSFRVYLCEIRCKWHVIFKRSLFSVNCTTTSGGKLRTRRAAESEDKSLVDKLKEKAKEKLPKLLKHFDELVSEAKVEAMKGYKEVQDHMRSVYEQNYGKDPPEQSLIISSPDMRDTVRSSAALIKPPSPSWNWELVRPSGGAELFGISRGESGDLKFVIGDGLTQAGIALLGDAVANMSIGDLESMLDFKNVDPIAAYKVILTLRELYFTLISELIDVVFGGKLDDAVMQSFDYKMRGVMKFPRMSVTYYHYEYPFFVPPIPCLFKYYYGTEGYWGMNFYMKFDILSMVATGTVDPYVGVMAYGGGGANCFIFKGVLQLNGYIMETHLPATVEIGFYKFPLDIGMNVDIVIFPLKFELLVEAHIKVMFFMRKRKKRGFRRFVRRVARGISRFVRKVVKFFKKIFKWKLLFRKVLWKWGLKPIRIPGILRKRRKREDLSPPSFSPQHTRSKRSASTDGSGCRVYQIPNRSELEPAVVLASDCTDEVSKVQMTYSVGTARGGTNIVNNMKFQGPSAIIEGRLATRGPLYFTVAARNSQGTVAKTFCSLKVFDITPPEGMIKPAFQKSSDPSFLKMEGFVFDQSPLKEVRVAIGFGPGVRGDAVRRWESAVPLRMFGPPGPRGVGYKVQMTFTNLNLKHNSLLFGNLLVRNSLNYVTVITSPPVHIDLSPPTSLDIVRPTSDRIVKDFCKRYTLRKWYEFCPSKETSIPNHRTVVDSSDCSVLWNGHEADKREVRWTMNNRFISTRFRRFHDNETDIRGYTLCVGSSPCKCDRFPLYDPHETFRYPSEWNYIGFAVNDYERAFGDGKYFPTITAINKVTMGGPFATSVCHVRPFVIDTSPPKVEFVGSMRYDVGSRRFRFVLKANDEHSGLRRVLLGAGRTRHDLSVAPLKLIHTFPNDPDSIESFTGELSGQLHITHGTKVYIHLLVYNNVDLEKEYTSHRPFVVDNTPPLPGIVAIGRDPDKHRKFFGRQEELCVSWRDFHDPESGIASYTVRLGSCRGCKDLLLLEDLPDHRRTACLPKSPDKHLEQNKEYFATVEAFHGGSEGLSVSVNSSGSVFDKTPPVLGSVVDGSLAKMKDQTFASDRSFYALQWRAAKDPESSIAGYRVTVLKKSLSSPKTDVLKSSDFLAPSDHSFSVDGLHLQHRDRLHAVLSAVNGADLERKKQTSGLTVDLTPPVIEFLKDGDDEQHQRRFQSSLDHLKVVFKSRDPESDVAEWKFQMYRFISGQRHLSGREFSLPRNSSINTGVAMIYHMDKLQLAPGHRYGLRMTVLNRAGLSSVQDSTGVTIDISPPHIEALIIGSLLNEEPQLHDGFLWHQAEDVLTVTVRAFDPESEVEFVWIALGHRPGSQDVMAFRRFDFSHDRFISLHGLNLTASDLKAQPPTPVYYVTVRAQNFAGLSSPGANSLPILVVPSDAPGEVFDGPTAVPREAQVEVADVTATFKDFRAPLHGVSHFEFAVGSKPGLDDVQPFTADGVVNVNEERSGGQVNLPVPLKDGRKHFVMVRAVTNGNKPLESVSSGTKVERTPPSVLVDLMSAENFENGTIYKNSESFPSYRLRATGRATTTEAKITQWPFWGNTSSSLSKEKDSPTEGSPKFINAFVENDLGLSGTNHSIVVVVDKTPPELASFYCDKVVGAISKRLTCRIYGLRDQESCIRSVEIALLRSSRDTEKLVWRKFQGPVTSHEFLLTPFDLQKLGDDFVARVTVVNAARLRSVRFSGDIAAKAKPPAPAVVIDVGDVFVGRFEGMEVSKSFSSGASNTNDQRCQVSKRSMTVAWEAFPSELSPIIRYEVAIGSYRGAADIKPWTTVPLDRLEMSFSNLDLTRSETVFAAVRATAASGASVEAFSNGLSISNLAVGSTNAKVVVFDGLKDSRYQSDPMTLTASWNFEAEPCPILLTEWAIIAADGRFVQNYTDMKGLTNGTYFGLNAKDGDTFFNLVRVTTALNLTYTFRSRGVAIKLQPIVPGVVRDGKIRGHDLQLQDSASSLSANWEGFKIPHSSATASGNLDEAWEPKIEYYEAGVGTDPNGQLDNVVPFTYVGLNTSVTFHNLKLTPGLTKYHMTVRAYSRWFTKGQATSSGVQVGVQTDITESTASVKPFINGRNATVSWKDFKSSVPVKTYYIGVRKTDLEHELNCEDIIVAEEGSRVLANYFDLFARSDVGLDTAFHLTHLPAAQAANYTVEVIGMNTAGRCARTKAFFFTDYTAPLQGQVAITGATFKNIFFVRSRDSVTLQWKNVKDPESGLEAVKVTLMQQKSCKSSEPSPALLKNGKEAVFLLRPSATQFELENLNLQADTVYFVEVEATNRAGSSTTQRSLPILLEEAAATPGVVRAGPNFTQPEAFFFGDDDNLTFSFLHTFAKSHLEMEDIDTSSSQWTAIKGEGFSNVLGYPWQLYHVPQMAAFGAGGLELSMERLIGQRGVKAAAVQRPLNFKTGGSVSFELRAPDREFGAVGFVVSAGPPGEVAGFHPSRGRQEEVFCGCCITEERRKNCSCDCSKYLQSIVENVESSASTPAPRTGGWEVVPEARETTEGRGELVAATRSACGLQILPLGGKKHHNATLWCFNKETGLSSSETLSLGFDASHEARRFQLDYSRSPVEGWDMRLLVDGQELVTMSGGLPSFPTPLTSVFHIWNKWEALAPIGNLRDPFKVTAVVKNIKYPNPKTEILRYGNPFRISTAAPLVYEARLALLDANTTNTRIISYITPWTKIYEPCVPCDTVCSSLFCDPNCPLNALRSLTRFVPGVNYTRWVSALNGNITRFQAQVRLRSVGGFVVKAASLPATLDITPPEQSEEVPLMYFDVESKEPYKSVSYQASNSTLRVMFSVLDPESGIREYEWAAGTTPGGTDIFNFTRVNSTLPVERSGLALEHNTTYFVSLIAVNRAGFASVFEDEDGVRVLCRPPDVADVIAEVPGSKDFDPEVGATDTKVTRNGDEIRAKWTTPPQDGETKSEFCVGSRPDVADDVVDCLKMTHRSSGQTELTFKDGQMAVTNLTSVNVTDVIEEKAESRSQGGGEKKPQSGQRPGIHLEPGKTLHYHVRLCNAADKCSEKPLDKVQVMDSRSQIVVPGPAGPEAALLMTGRRRKRDIDAGDFQVLLRGAAAESTTLIVGVIEDGTDYRSDSVLSYVSYIVGVKETISKTSRFLDNRIKGVLSPTFFAATVGQREMSSAIHFEVNLRAKVPSKTSPQLIYWNKDSGEWRLAYFTCVGKGPSPLAPSGRFSTAVCRTQSGAANFSTPPGAPQRFLQLETQFAVAFVNDELSNHPPVPRPVVPLRLNGTEEPQIARLRLTATDPEGDAIQWAIDEPLPRKGRAMIDAASGLLTYRPLIGAVGSDQVRVRVTDRPVHPAIPARSAWLNVSIALSTRVNAPLLVVMVDGKLQTLSAGQFENSVSFSVLGVHEDQPECNKPTQVDVYGLDLDVGQGVSFMLSSTNNSIFRLGNVTQVPPQLNTSIENIPNDPSLYSWNHVQLFYDAQDTLWTPTLTLIGVDDSGQPSRPLRLDLSVVEDARCRDRSLSVLVIAVIATCCALLFVFCVAAFVIWQRRRGAILPSLKFKTDDVDSTPKAQTSFIDRSRWAQSLARSRDFARLGSPTPTEVSVEDEVDEQDDSWAGSTAVLVRDNRPSPRMAWTEMHTLEPQSPGANSLEFTNPMASHVILDDDMKLEDMAEC